ncbi:hypothetical protein MBLNU457_g2674t2 [Dothideomycetes sp. NU457]
MPVVHIVLFEFKPTLSRETIVDACQKMLDLSNKCMHPQTNKPYVKSHGGGRDNSPEGHQGGFTHGFVFEFENDEDRDYYLTKDKVHLEFVSHIGDLVQNIRVVDFVPGVL